MSKLLRNELIHMVVTFLAAGLYFFVSQNVAHTLIFIICAVGVDADHLFDYVRYIHQSKSKATILGFLSGKYFHLSNRLFVLLHSWELSLIGLWLYFTGIGAVYLPIALGLATHYLVDSMTNDVGFLSYFFSVRVAHQFKLNKIVNNVPDRFDNIIHL